MNVRIAAFVVPGEERRGGFPTEIAVDALLIDKKFSGSVRSPLVGFIRHKFERRKEPFTGPVKRPRGRCLSNGKTKLSGTNSRTWLVFTLSGSTIFPMFSERSYSRNAYRGERTSALTWLLCAMVAAFVLQIILGSRWMHGEELLYRGIGLTVPGLAAGKLWTLLTNAFLHRPGFIFHPIGNLFLLYFLGRELMPIIGQKRFFGVAAAATLLGGLAWTAVHWRFGGGDMLIGATTAVYALAALYACFFPYRELNFLLFFVLPVNLKPKHIVFTLVAFDALGLFLYEIPGEPLPMNIVIAHSAHLGGVLAAYLYFRFVHDNPWTLGRLGRTAVAAPARSRTIRPAVRVTPDVPSETVIVPVDIRVEVDRILDKINSEGFAALTLEEKRMLDEAKDSISRR